MPFDPRTIPNLRLLLDTSLGHFMCQEGNDFRPATAVAADGDRLGGILDSITGFSCELEGDNTANCTLVLPASQSPAIKFSGALLRIFCSQAAFNEVLCGLPFTLGFKVRLHSASPAYQHLFGTATYVSDGFKGWSVDWSLSGTSKIGFWAATGAANIASLATSNSLSVDGNEHYVLIYSDGTNLRINFDGTVSGPASFSNLLSPGGTGRFASNDLWIGGTHSSTDAAKIHLSSLFYANADVHADAAVTAWKTWVPSFATSVPAPRVVYGVEKSPLVSPDQSSGLFGWWDFTRPAKTLADGSAGGLRTTAVAGDYGTAGNQMLPGGAEGYPGGTDFDRRVTEGATSVAANADQVGYVDNFRGRAIQRPFYQTTTANRPSFTTSNPPAGKLGCVHFAGAAASVADYGSAPVSGEQWLTCCAFPRGAMTWMIAFRTASHGTAKGHYLMGYPQNSSLVIADPDNATPNAIVLNTSSGSAIQVLNPPHVNLLSGNAGWDWNILSGRHHLKVAELYLNGYLIASGTDAGMFLQPGNNNPIYIGRPGLLGHDFNGDLGHLACWAGCMPYSQMMRHVRWMANDLGVAGVKADPWFSHRPAPLRGLVASG